MTEHPLYVDGNALAGPLALGFIVSLLLALRVSYGLAATAVDVPFSPRFSWVHSRGNAWPIIGALFVIYFGGAFVTAVAALLTHGIMRGVLGADEAAAVLRDQATPSGAAFALGPATLDRPAFYDVLRLGHLRTIMRRLEVLPQC